MLGNAEIIKFNQGSSVSYDELKDIYIAKFRFFLERNEWETFGEETENANLREYGFASLSADNKTVINKVILQGLTTEFPEVDFLDISNVTNNDAGVLRYSVKFSLLGIIEEFNVGDEEI